jgi:hypothetical protein
VALTQTEHGLASRALAVARGELGTRETAPNVCKYSQWYGMAGQPWCAMFVAWCYVRAGDRTAFKRGERWSYVFHVSAAARRGIYGLSTTRNPRPGDVVVFGAPGFPEGHIGLFETWVDRRVGTFRTIEGNTGNEVGRRARSTRDVVAFVRIRDEGRARRGPRELASATG